MRAEALRCAVLVCAGLMMGLAGAVPGTVAQEGREECNAERTNMVIEYGDVIQCAISSAGERDVFRFVGGAGQTIRVRIADQTSGSARPCLQVRDPHDTPLRRRACGNRDQDFLLERTGTYRILVTEDANDGEQTVRYTLVADRINPTSPAAVPIKHDQPLTAKIDRLGDLDVYYFEAGANDTVTIQIAKRTRGAAAPCFQLYDSAGEALTNRMCSNRNEELLLRKAGRHSILVTDRPGGGQEEIEYRLRLSCVGACPSLGFREVLGCFAFKGAPLKQRTVRFKQPNERQKPDSTDVRGCAKFFPVPGKAFEFQLAGRNLPG